MTCRSCWLWLQRQRAVRELTPAREQELEKRWRKDYCSALAEANRGREANRQRAEEMFFIADLRGGTREAVERAVLEVYLGQ